MNVRFFADHCVPTEINTLLRDAGFEVTALRDVLPVRSPDALVLAKARELGTVLLSLNGDFSDIVAYPPATHGGVIALQLHNHPEVIPQLMQRLLRYLKDNQSAEHFMGKLFLVEAHRIRIRH